MKEFECKHDFSEIKFGDWLRKFSQLGEMEEEFTSRTEIQKQMKKMFLMLI
jgi:DNA polymerase II large subunit